MFIESNVVFAYLKVYLFSLLILCRPFEIATTRNDMFFVHCLFICLIIVSGKAQCLMILYTVAKII